MRWEFRVEQRLIELRRRERALTQREIDIERRERKVIAARVLGGGSHSWPISGLQGGTSRAKSTGPVDISADSSGHGEFGRHRKWSAQLSTVAFSPAGLSVQP